MLLAVGCGATWANPPPAPTAAPPAAGVDVIETIEETTVGDLGGVSVPMGNMFVDTYTLPDGTTTKGLVCALALESGAVFVGKGSVVTVGATAWEVVAIEKPAGKLGSVSLKKR